MATDLEDMLGTEEDEDDKPLAKPKPIDEEEPPAPAIGAPTAQPLIPPPMASAQKTIAPVPNTNDAGNVAPPTATNIPSATVASPMSRYNALQATGAPVSHKTGFGGGLLKVLDAAGNVIVPGVMANIPGTTMHQHFAEEGALNQAKAQTGIQDTQSQIAQRNSQVQLAQAKAVQEGQPKPKEEEWGVVPNVQGPNGEPVQQEKNSGQIRLAPVQGATVVDKNQPKAAHVTYDNGIPVSVVGKDGQVFDVNDPKLPPELKPLVDAANRAHGQHVTEDTDKQARAAALAQPNKNDARSDRSYQFSSTQIEKARQPVEQRLEKINVALDNLNQKNPQADALAAPEILTAMVGGQGSGLRMNEAEISRIIGGATKWTELKTALNKWSLDPQHATFTDEQRGQMQKILQGAKAKLTAKQAIFEDANGKLIESEDPKEHRKIVNDARQQLDKIDAAEGGGGTGKLTIDEAREYLQKAGGDKEKARAMAKADKREF